MDGIIRVLNCGCGIADKCETMPLQGFQIPWPCGPQFKTLDVMFR